MEIVAAVLFGLAVVAGLAGFHLGPHTHAVAGVAGILSAVFFLIALITGHATPLLGTVLGADLLVTGTTAAIATNAIRHRDLLGRPPRHELRGTDGVALERLDPTGTVRIQGETWSAVAQNPPILPGTHVQVVGRTAVRLEVWGDTEADPHHLFAIEPADVPADGADDERSTTK